MHVTRTGRGFETLEHPKYPNGGILTLAQQSSVIGDYPDAWDRPGTSSLWIGAHHHLNREEVREFVQYLQRWLETGRLGE